MSIDYTSYSEDKDIFTNDMASFDDEKIVDEPIEEETGTNDLMGVVANTEKVYMRQNPDKTSPYVTVMNKGDEVVIDGIEEDAFGNEWYHLTNAKGASGYTMLDFIETV